jgi:cyclopropane-fatty-acyl-phospholipid synthase
MANDSKTLTTAMEGDGSYNRNSDLQLAGIGLALPFLKEAALSISLGSDEPLVIADYGSSQGRNSMLPMGLAIDALRARAGSERIVEVIHTDQPSNDFASLFTALRDGSNSYLAGRAAIFVSAVGRSYFDPILPPGRVHLGWTSWALHWMSRNPVDVPDHSHASMSASAAAHEAVKCQLADDWRRFLLARSTEMRVGAKLVSLFIGRTPNTLGFDWVFGEFWRVVKEMGREGLISPQEELHITAPVGWRSIADIEAPFCGGPFAGLSLEHATVIEGPDPFWDRYCETGNAQQLGRGWAGMMRATGAPVIAAALDPGRDSDALLDELFTRYADRIAASPQRSQHFLAIAVVRKSGEG